jgi:hypothetical protein
MQGELIRYTLKSQYPIVMDAAQLFAQLADKLDDYLPDWLKVQTRTRLPS